jgi:urease accessory protein
MTDPGNLRALPLRGRTSDSAQSTPDLSDRPPTAAELQRLFAWLSPAFPVGAFSYSHGLEWSVEDGTISDAAALEVWLAGILRHGGGRTDAVFLAHAYRMAAADDLTSLGDVAELAAAFQPTRERHLESTAQGRAYLSTVVATWPNAKLDGLAGIFPADATVAYPIAVAVAAASHGIPLRPTAVAYLQAFAANLVSAGVRAIPIGQTDGQRIIARLAPVLEEIAGEALAANLSDLGGAAFRADIASMKHETQYTRLFRS